MRWKATCLMYTELSIYTECVKSIKTHVWWFLARKRPYLIYKISALLSVCMGNEPKGMKCDFKRRLGFLCDARQAASPKHILFEKTTLLLSGLHCDKYVEEWSQLMINICEFVYDIYRQRKIIYDSMCEVGIT